MPAVVPPVIFPRNFITYREFSTDIQVGVCSNDVNDPAVSNSIEWHLPNGSIVTTILLIINIVNAPARVEQSGEYQCYAVSTIDNSLAALSTLTVVVEPVPSKSSLLTLQFTTQMEPPQSYRAGSPWNCDVSIQK